jgi:hypothetical protein
MQFPWIEREPAMTYESLHIAVVDIGKLANLGWAIEGPFINAEGTDIDRCLDSLVSAKKWGALALGFEAPMFVPYGRDRLDLDKARSGEEDRAFSASAGASVLTKALVIVPYILEGLRRRVGNTRPTFRWRDRITKRDLLLFEAFVSHMGKTVSHERCARLALTRFREGWRKESLFESAIKESNTLNLLGAILLRMGWSDDVKMLSEPCLVVRHKGNSN